MLFAASALDAGDGRMSIAELPRTGNRRGMVQFVARGRLRVNRRESV
jgi:hypothetical protein